MSHNLYQFFIFDFDGTLVNSKEDIVVAANYALKKVGLKSLPHEKIYKCVGSGVIEFIESALHFSNADLHLTQKTLQHFQDYYKDHCSVHTTWYEGAYELLKKLSSSHQLAILTNKPSSFTHQILEDIKSDIPFLEIIAGDDDFPKKPDPSSMHHLINKAGVDPSETLMIGDSQVDAETAKNAGVDCVLLSHGFEPQSELEKSPSLKILLNFKDLSEWLSY